MNENEYQTNSNINHLIGIKVEAFERGDKVGTHDLLVSLDSGDSKERSSVDIVCVIDISGSMATGKSFT